MITSHEFNSAVNKAKSRFIQATYERSDASDLRSMREFRRIQTSLANVSTATAVRVVPIGPESRVPDMPEFYDESSTEPGEIPPVTPYNGSYVNALQELPSELRR